MGNCDAVVVIMSEWWGWLWEGCMVSVQACYGKGCASEEEGELIESDLGGVNMKWGIALNR